MKNKELKIEHGIPIPDSTAVNRGPVVKAIKSMKVGDSFLWYGKSVSNAHVYAKMAKIRVVTRTVDSEKHIRRVWRIA